MHKRKSYKIRKNREPPSNPHRQPPKALDEGASRRIESRKVASSLAALLLVILLATFYPLSITHAQDGQIITSTPNADGSVAHVIQYGENLIEIAQAYGITLSELYGNNPSLNPQNPKYYAGEVLIIRLGFTATPNISPTVTQRPPTRTLGPTRTATLTRTPIPTRTATQIVTPTPTPPPPLLALNDQTIGYGFIVVSAIGLLIVIFKGFIKTK